MSMKRYELTKEQWERIKSLLPPEEMGKRGRPRKDNPIMLNGMLWIVRSGAQWRELPETYGPWQSIYAQFAKWGDDGTLEVVFHTLSTDADMENLNMDSTCVRVHESANGEEKTADKAVGRTKSGWNTRLHAVVDIWWSVFSRKSSGFAESPPDMTSRMLPSWPLCILPPSLFCYFSTISAFFRISPSKRPHPFYG